MGLLGPRTQSITPPTFIYPFLSHVGRSNHNKTTPLAYSSGSGLAGIPFPAAFLRPAHLFMATATVVAITKEDLLAFFPIRHSRSATRGPAKISCFLLSASFVYFLLVSSWGVSVDALSHARRNDLGFVCNILCCLCFLCVHHSEIRQAVSSAINASVLQNRTKGGYNKTGRGRLWSELIKGHLVLIQPFLFRWDHF